MRVAWKKNARLKPQVLMDKLREIVVINSDGQVSYRSFEKQEIDSVILTMIDFGNEFSYSTIKRIYLQAQEVCAKEMSFTKEAFLEQLNLAAINHRNKKENKYVMVTSVSVYGGFPKQLFNTGKSIVRCFPTGLPKKYSGRSKHEWNGDLPPMPKHYCPVTVTVKSKDKMDAFHSAIHELDYVRGINAIFINPLSEFGFGQVGMAPLSRVVLGGLHSLHNENGQIIDKNLYWFERNYKVRGCAPLKQANKIEKATKSLSKKLALHNEGYKIKSAVVRYARAFDEIDRNVVIQKLWSALESIVSPNENNADSIVKRCSFMFDDREYHAQILEHLREYRNRNVHAGYEVDDLDYHCFQLQMFFKQAVIFYLANYKIFPTLAMANRFLDLPSGFEDLLHLKMCVEKALHYQRYYDSAPIPEADF